VLKEFISQVSYENKQLETENNRLLRQNEQFASIISSNTKLTLECEKETDHVASSLNQLILEYDSIRTGEHKFTKSEK
jgi:hypothetical protein